METSTVSRYLDTEFQGIMPDTGVAGFSTAEKPQVIALKRIVPSLEIEKSPAGEHKIWVGKGDATSLGTINVDNPIGSITFHVIPLNTPFSLCIKDMKRMNVKLDNLRNLLIQGENIVPVIMKFGHPWMLLQQELSIAYCYLTVTELRRLHRRFGHPSVKRLVKVLRKAGHDVENKVVEKLTKYWRQCHLHGKAPCRFKFRLPRQYEFNNTATLNMS